MKKKHGLNAIPSREQFHREYAGEIRLSDFNTSYPNNYHKQEYTMLERINRKKFQERGKDNGKTKEDTALCI